MEVLVVGGEHSFVAGPFANKLSKVGIALAAHWDWALRRPPTTLPKPCQGVVVIHDMVSHALSDAAKDLATAAGLPFALVPRKFSAALPVLQQAGIAPPDAIPLPEDDPPPANDPGQDDDLRTWITMSLEAQFEEPDEVFIASAMAFDPTQQVSTISTMVHEIRTSMKRRWRDVHEDSEAAKSLAAVAGAWLRRQMPLDMEGPGTLPGLRSQTILLFGLGVPESVLVAAGFQTWEIRGAVTRQRVRAAVKTGDAVLQGADAAAFARWIDKGVGTCPILMKGGQPLEVVSIILRARPDMAVNMVGRVYRRMTGAGLGPYYYAAVKWAHDNPLSAPAVDVEVAPVEESKPTPVDSRTSEILRALFGDDAIPEDALDIARDARRALDAVTADAAAVADGREPTETVSMVSGRAADIIAARDLSALAAKQAEAEAALKAAEDAYLQAQEEFRIAQARISSLRR